eukprot:ctg_866.g327
MSESQAPTGKSLGQDLDAIFGSSSSSGGSGSEDESEHEREQAIASAARDAAAVEGAVPVDGRGDVVGASDALQADGTVPREVYQALRESIPPQSEWSRYYLLRLPHKFIGVEPLDRQQQHSRASDHPFQAPRMIRWRRHPSTGALESNTRLVRWSDGSLTLHIGASVSLVVRERPLDGPDALLFRPQPTSHRRRSWWGCGGRVDTELRVKMDARAMSMMLAGQKANAPSVLRRARRDRHGTAERRIRTAALTRAPELEEKALLDMEAQRQRAQQRIEAQRRRREQRWYEMNRAAERWGSGGSARVERVSRTAAAAAAAIGAGSEEESASEASARTSSDEEDVLNNPQFGRRARPARTEDDELDRLEAMLEGAKDTEEEEEEEGKEPQEGAVPIGKRRRVVQAEEEEEEEA